MTDGFGREIYYLRLSVTERCNLRCRYCMPEDGICKKDHAEMLTEDEMIMAVKAAAALGFRKLRITGGEPLVKKNILSICSRAAVVRGIEELCLTTNGTLLPRLAKPLREAGVQRVNISLDTLNREKYAYITRRDASSSARRGIESAIEAGFSRIKINTVLIGGFNDDEINDLAQLTVQYPVDVRFIELMPMDGSGEFNQKSMIPSEAVLARLPELEPVEPDSGVARLYHLSGSQGNIGLISPVSRHFCAECNRIRPTAQRRRANHESHWRITMDGIPILGFAAYSGTGKTTLIEQLVRSLKAQGLRIAVIKHDGHDFEIDREGKDSWRFTQAGADISIITSTAKTALIEQRPLSFVQVAAMVRDVDLILVEGYKQEDFTQIGICRQTTGKGFPADIENYAAVVTDAEMEVSGIPGFGFDDIGGLTEFIMKNMDDFTHFNEQGRAKMVDVGEKPSTRRAATAGARVLVSRETFDLICSGGMKKGDVLTVAQIAGIMGAKRTPDLIPMCHPVQVSGIDLSLNLDEARCCVDIRATVSCDGRTGVEMEALTAASTAALTVYDMCKAVQKDMVITDIRLLEKIGGVHGDFYREENQS